MRTIRRRRERAPRIVFLEQGQYEALLDGLSPHPQLRAMVAVMLFGGLRCVELLRLTKADVDLEQGLLHVRAKEVCGQTWQPKTGSNRSVRIWLRLAEELARWRSPAGTPWYFPSPRGTRWDEDNFSKSLRRAQKFLNPRWTSLHFRHTFGTTLARAGISLFQISRLMGNSPQIAAKHYAFL